jgi:uncharacterized protein
MAPTLWLSVNLIVQKGEPAMATDDEYPIVHSPLERRITRDGVSVDVHIYRGINELGWLLEIVDHLGGSTVWEDTFPSDEVALAEAMETIDREGIGSFAEERPALLH